jgi:hypothetical protein
MFQRGYIPWNKGIPTSEANRIKISESLKGENNPMYGKKHSQKTRKKISEALTGRYFSEERKREISKSRLGNKRHLGIPNSEETKRKISKSLLGNKNRWQGGKTLLSFTIRQCFKYRQWRDDVFTRDKFTCQECGQIGGRLHAHHIIPFASIMQKYEIITLEEALNCEELWSMNNGITYCKKCHLRKPKKIKI